MTNKMTDVSDTFDRKRPMMQEVPADQAYHDLETKGYSQLRRL